MTPTGAISAQTACAPSAVTSSRTSASWGPLWRARAPATAMSSRRGAARRRRRCRRRCGRGSPASAPSSCPTGRPTTATSPSGAEAHRSPKARQLRLQYPVRLSHASTPNGCSLPLASQLSWPRRAAASRCCCAPTRGGRAPLLTWRRWARCCLAAMTWRCAGVATCALLDIPPARARTTSRRGATRRRRRRSCARCWLRATRCRCTSRSGGAALSGSCAPPSRPPWARSWAPTRTSRRPGARAWHPTTMTWTCGCCTPRERRLGASTPRRRGATRGRATTRTTCRATSCRRRRWR